MAARGMDLDAFLEAYERYVRAVLRPTQRLVLDHLEPWKEPAYWEKYQTTNRIPIPSPVHRITTRIKRPEQVVDKILRKRESFPRGLHPDSFRRMHDVIGVRVLVYVLSHLPLVDRELGTCGVFEISDEEPPTAYLSPDQTRTLSLDHLEQLEKESGYASVHYVLRLREADGVPESPWFELQVQTLAQELWSTLEHHLGYKPGRGTTVAARRQLRILSKLIGAIDEHFDFLYQELNRHQEEISYADADPIGVENLPPLLAELGISCAQRDVNNIIKFLGSRGVTTVGELRRLATPRRLDVIRSTYLATAGRLPFNLEVIASLAAVVGAHGQREEVRRIRSQIAYSDLWGQLRNDVEKG